LKDLFVITHTESVHHVEKLGGGWYDTPLTERGKNDASRIATRLFDRLGTREIPILSSDLQRCTDMAAIFQKVFASPYQVDQRLREMSCGSAEGQAREWLDAHLNPVPDDENRLDHQVFEGAESRREVGMRVTRFLEDLCKTDHEQVLVITHGFALTFLIAAWLRVPVDNMDYCEFRATPGGVTHLSENKQFGNRVLVRLNDTSYVDV